MLRESIERNKQRIHQLESSLHKSGMKAKGLEKMVANLKKDVEEKEAMVAELSSRVENLQTQVAGLETQVQERSPDTLVARDQAIEERRRELATVFVAVGNKKELSTKGVITAKGGVLGMGKTIQPTGKGERRRVHGDRHRPPDGRADDVQAGQGRECPAPGRLRNWCSSTDGWSCTFSTPSSSARSGSW